jgi:hypothetical protein
MSARIIDLVNRGRDPGLRGFPRAAESVWWAGRAIWNEVVAFRFEYPLETSVAARSGNPLHYYVYSDHLFFDAMELDSEGIPLLRSRRLGTARNPAYVAWYGLVSLERFLRGGDPSHHRQFLKQVEWLVAHGVTREDGALVWPYGFNWQEGRCCLKAPWISAMAQGLAISLLVRAYRGSRHDHLLDACRAASRVFEKDVGEGGVRSVEEGHVLFEEYPAYPLPRVLDGFLFSLVGLYDLFRETGDPRVQRLFAEGVEGLKHVLPSWNYRGRWSWYGSHGYLCPPHYHALNRALLVTLGGLTGERELADVAEAWAPGNLTARDRIEVFLVFVLTKNLARVRLRRAKRF